MMRGGPRIASFDPSEGALLGHLLEDSETTVADDVVVALHLEPIAYTVSHPVWDVAALRHRCVRLFRSC
jgi:hypothetical protein